MFRLNVHVPFSRIPLLLLATRQEGSLGTHSLQTINGCNAARNTRGDGQVAESGDWLCVTAHKQRMLRNPALSSFSTEPRLSIYSNFLSYTIRHNFYLSSVIPHSFSTHTLFDYSQQVYNVCRFKTPLPPPILCYRPGSYQRRMAIKIYLPVSILLPQQSLR